MVVGKKNGSKLYYRSIYSRNRVPEATCDEAE